MVAADMPRQSVKLITAPGYTVPTAATSKAKVLESWWINGSATLIAWTFPSTRAGPTMPIAGLQAWVGAQVMWSTKSLKHSKIGAPAGLHPSGA
jgi:hypothetical protein